jgi:hypothetical protein
MPEFALKVAWLLSLDILAPSKRLFFLALSAPYFFWY